jgi:hypothetical protein
VIWGAIGMKVFYYFSAEDEMITIDHRELLSDAVNDKEDIKPGSNEAGVTYVDLKRDPFLFKKKRIVRKREKTAPAKQMKFENDIDFVINGVIWKKNRKLVILQDRTNNSTMFLHEGEKYKNLEINFISPTSVSLLQNNKEKKITIE